MSRDAIGLGAFHIAGPSGRSWSKDGDDYSLRIFPFDTPANARNMAGSGSSCATAAMRILQIAEVDGTISGVDRLRLPCAGHFDAPSWLERFARETGLYREPKAGEQPDIDAGCILQIGGDDGLPPAQWTRGGALHVITCVGKRDDGTFDTIEGGKIDLGNPRPSPHNCTAIGPGHREVCPRPDGSWWVRTAGDKGPGCKLAWWAQMGDAPCLGDE